LAEKCNVLEIAAIFHPVRLAPEVSSDSCPPLAARYNGAAPGEILMGRKPGDAALAQRNGERRTTV